ncbi:gp166 [uncultured Mediterranean phage uvMED]|nr:gp166 [uncultured Mediterranean phage uvMED]
MWTAIWFSWSVLCVIALVAPEAKSVPVIPNFQQGVLSSKTTTKTKVNEVINSYEYRTGYEYSASGTNIAPINGDIAPRALTTTSNTLNGISSRWVGLDPVDKPVWNIVNQGASFQFVETLQGPGLVNHTLINRETDIESLTETTSTFTQ